jgi:iron complex outermembrane receptor protein
MILKTNNFMVRRAVALALAASAPLIVHAQTSSTAETSGSTQSTGSRELEEITVTATRRETTLQNAPVSVIAYDQATLDELNVDTLADYLKYTPGLQASQSSQPGAQFLEMRGVAAYGGNIAQAGTIGGKAAVATYLDDTPLMAGASGSRDVNLYLTDINRVEVLEGPQGTLFGSASLSGAIRNITNKPDPSKLDARITLSSGWTDGAVTPNRSVEGMVNVPVIPDRFAVRVAAYDSYSAGYFDNTPATLSMASNVTILKNPAKFANTQYGVLNNYDFQEKGMNPVDYKGGRVEALLNITDNWKASIQYTRQDLDTQGPFSSDGDANDLKVIAFNPEFLRDNISLASWNLEGHMAALDVIYSGSYFKRHIDQLSDYSSYAASGPSLPYYDCNYPKYTYCQPPRQTWTVQSDLRIIQNEFRIASDPADRLSYIVGAYQHQNGCAPPECGTSIDFNYYGAIANGFLQHAPVASPANSYIPGLRPPGDMFFTDMSPIEKELSFFGDFTYKITDKFHLSAGVRHYKINQNAVGSVNFGSLTDPASGVNFSNNLKPISESNFIERGNLEYLLSDNVHFYTTYSEGFNAGGYNRNGGVPGKNGETIPLGYNTETTRNYEVGWKMTSADRRLRFNGDAYLIEWNNIVVSVQNIAISNAIFFTNAGRAKIKGLEGQLEYLLSDRWSVQGSAAYTDGKLVYVPSTVPDIVSAGSRLARQPVVAANARLRYDFSLAGTRSYASLGAIHEGNRYNGVTLQRTVSPAYTIMELNLGATWGDHDKWEGKLFIHNLTNNRYEVSSTVGNGPDGGFYRVIGQPLTLGVSIGYRL